MRKENRGEDKGRLRWGASMTNVAILTPAEYYHEKYGISESQTDMKYTKMLKYNI